MGGLQAASASDFRSPAARATILLLAPPVKKRDPGQFLHEVETHLGGLWSSDRKSHTEALASIYRLLKGREDAVKTGALEKELGAEASSKAKALEQRLGNVLTWIENFLVDLRAVHLLCGLNDERALDGLEKIAMNHNRDDAIPAVRDLGKDGAVGWLETLAGCHKDPLIACAAVLGIKGLSRFDRYNRLGDIKEPHSDGAYKLGRLFSETVTTEARAMCLWALVELVKEGGNVGKAAQIEIDRLGAEGADLFREGKRAEKIAPDIITALKNIPDKSDLEQQTNAWSDRRNNGNLQDLDNAIKAVAEQL